MVIIRVRCDSCGGTWEAYSKLREFDQVRECPHCGKRIDRLTWQQNILPAFDAVRAANMELMNDHIKYHAPVFQVDFIADSLFANASKVSE